jgi:hypothetical protein
MAIGCLLILHVAGDQQHTLVQQEFTAVSFCGRVSTVNSIPGSPAFRLTAIEGIEKVSGP